MKLFYGICMKLSSAWIIDHLSVSKNDISINDLLKRFNATTAEIDAVDHISIDLTHLYAVTIGESEQEVRVSCPERATTWSLPLRKDMHRTKGFWYLVKVEGATIRWATLEDVGSSKEGLLPALKMNDQDGAGAWRDSIEKEDTIITIDNKALTNRPDLWGHRGCAREVAALLQKELRKEEYFLADMMISHHEKGTRAGVGHSFTISLDDGECGSICRRFAGLAVPEVAYTPSLPWMAVRLARVDIRPLDVLVDMTNYVMADWGQPMHAFDAEKLPNKHIHVRCAYAGEKIRLLDGDEVTLATKDCVISDGDTAVSVAGIMGGSSSAISSSTRSLFLESANFEPTPIRLTATRLKKRTDASTRFEKNLDPNQNTAGILRYMKLLQEAHIPFKAEDTIVSLGPLWREITVDVSHDMIESKIGMQVAVEKVIAILQHLDFGVAYEAGIYAVTVPTFRAIRDVTMPEDIVEEIARFVGYRKIVPILPTRQLMSFNTKAIERKRRLKHILAYGLSMHEVQTYAFYDEMFLTKLSFDPLDAPRVANPLSEHWQRLVTSLVPNLISCAVANEGVQDSVRFFEINRTWYAKERPVELLECAGIWYERKKSIDFYEGKKLVEKIMNALDISIRWLKPKNGLALWYDPYQAAELWYQDRLIGRAGKSSPSFLHRVLEGDAFFFELDANFLVHAQPGHATFTPLPKYPVTEQDISVLVSRSVTVAGLEEAIRSADSRIKKVCLVDSFEKPEWPDQKSLTFRYVAMDEKGTLTKEMIDVIARHVQYAVHDIGGQIR
jgi:phenylalanyl-tRNA synthetase beta chain